MYIHTSFQSEWKFVRGSEKYGHELWNPQGPMALAIRGAQIFARGLWKSWLGPNCEIIIRAPIAWRDFSLRFGTGPEQWTVRELNRLYWTEPTERSHLNAVTRTELNELPANTTTQVNWTERTFYLTILNWICLGVTLHLEKASSTARNTSVPYLHPGDNTQAGGPRFPREGASNRISAPLTSQPAANWFVTLPFAPMFYSVPFRSFVSSKFISAVLA